jgi:hypothetical protein
MYSPKIRDDLIPLLYRLSRHEEKPMTRIVDEILRPEIERRIDRLNRDESHTPAAGSVSERGQPFRPKKNFTRTGI